MRFLFAFIVWVSNLVRVGRWDSIDDLDRDLRNLARAYRARSVFDLTTNAFDDPSSNVTGYYSTVTDYFTDTERQYSVVHNADGAVHFGLDWDGTYSRQGFYEQARMVEALLKERGAQDVLEIGSGKGFNSAYLAERNPGVAFTGVELTPAHVRIATARGVNMRNLRFIEGDFHGLSPIADGSVDVVFDVEAGCYADTPDKVKMLLSSVHRVLRPGGIFVTFDYWRADRFAVLDPRARLTVELIERAWVIEQFARETDWNLAAEAAGLRLTDRRDLGAAALPSILRLYRQARMFYFLMATPLRPVLAKVVRRSTHNAVCGMMLPYALGLGALEYRMAIPQKA